MPRKKRTIEELEKISKAGIARLQVAVLHAENLTRCRVLDAHRQCVAIAQDLLPNAAALARRGKPRLLGTLFRYIAELKKPRPRGNHHQPEKVARRSMPLLQDMLEACYYASGGEKRGPFAFRWPTPEKLAQIERKRQADRQRRAENKERHRRQAREWKRKNAERQNQRERVRYHGSKEKRERKAAALKKRRSEPAKRLADSERLARRQDKQRERERSRAGLRPSKTFAACRLARSSGPATKSRRRAARRTPKTGRWPTKRPSSSSSPRTSARNSKAASPPNPRLTPPARAT